MYLRIFMQALHATLLCHGEIDCLHTREVHVSHNWCWLLIFQEYRNLVGEIPLTDTLQALVKLD
jgi:hypothetical protein